MKIQIAVNNNQTTWNYVGPNGTANTYFTLSGESFPLSMDGNQYIRYKAYLATSNIAYTPSLDDVIINYLSYPSPYIFNSNIYDTGFQSRFSSFTWTGSQPGASILTIEARAGNQPDLADSQNWTQIGSGAAGSFTLPSSFDNKRYIQYRASFTPNNSTDQPKLEEIKINYKGIN